MVQIRIEKVARAFRNNNTNGYGAQIRLHQRYKTANGFRTQGNYYYIWPITLLELKYIITSARNAAATAKGMVELRSIVFYSRKERGRWRQGPRCSRCSRIRRIAGFRGLRVRTTLPRSRGCCACVPELTARRHRGRVLLRQPKTFTVHFKGGMDASSAIPHSIRLFVGLLSLLVTQQKWYHPLQQEVPVQSLIPRIVTI